MSYFRKFPSVPYLFSGETSRKNTVDFTNISAYSDIIDQVIDDSTVYRSYQVKDGERPDTVSYNLYGTTDYYWTFFILNPKLKTQGWPLSNSQLIEKLKLDIPGECLVCMPSQTYTNPETGYIQHPMISLFSPGTTVFGQISGASGVVYNKNTNLGQIFVRKTNDISFNPGEKIVDKLNNPTYSLEVALVNNPAYTAIQRIVDGDGDHIDVDFALDFRGRGSEGGSNTVGGVWDNLTNPDIYSESSPYTIVTHEQHYENVNSELSRIKVFRKSTVDKFAQLFRESLQR